MNTNDYIEFFEELDDNEETLNYIQPDKRREKNGRPPGKLTEQTQSFVRQQDDSRASFEFTYTASRHEAGWLMESIGAFYEQKWIRDVLRQVKGGKEASVYLCESGVADVDYLAAKVYRPRQFRNLKNDHVYRLGRGELDADGNVIQDDRDRVAILKRSAYGERVRHQSWIMHELQTLQLLFEAGADVPAPYASGPNSILMGYVGDAGFAAPTLNTVRLERDEARRLFERILHNIEVMLANDRIHGDLSAYNVLYWDGEITLIDFPQVVVPEANPLAYPIFARDVQRICEYFVSQGVDCDSEALTRQLWTKHGHIVHQAIDPVHLDEDDPDDRRLWQEQQLH